MKFFVIKEGKESHFVAAKNRHSAIDLLAEHLQYEDANQYTKECRPFIEEIDGNNILQLEIDNIIHEKTLLEWSNGQGGILGSTCF